MEAASLAIYARKLAGHFGLDISRQDTPFLEPEFLQYFKACEPFTMVSRERLYAHFQAINYVVQHKIAGDIVECGVWRGGTSMLGAMSLLGRQDTSRNIWLYDTFAGMTQPSAGDVSPWDGDNAKRLWNVNKEVDHNKWCFAPIEEVSRNIRSTGYPEEKTIFVQGDVEKTLNERVPESIAVLRLDTDWYDSTKKELEILFPKLSRGGVILIDDYGAWRGCKTAVDEYFSANNIPIMLHRTDYTGRSAIKITD